MLSLADDDDVVWKGQLSSVAAEEEENEGSKDETHAEVPWTGDATNLLLGVWIAMYLQHVLGSPCVATYCQGLLNRILLASVYRG